MNRNPADILNLLSKLTVRRFINILKVLAGYYLSRLLKRPVVFGMPVSVSLEPTTSCNLRCPECPSGLRSFTRPTGMMSLGFYPELLQQLEKESLYLIFYFQGEPFLNPDLLTMIKQASNKRFYTATSTNAHFFDDEMSRRTVESGLDRLIISIDGTTQESYESYRIGGNLQKVLEGAKNVIAWKRKLKSKTPYVIFQFLVIRKNENEVSELYRIANEIGIDQVALKTAQIYDFENGSELIPTDQKYSRYRLNIDGKWSIKNKLLNHCWKIWQSAVITWDGKVVPCCFDKDAQHEVGKFPKSRFKEIWTGKSFMTFRASVLRSRKVIDICTNCSEGGKVWGNE